MRGNWGRWIAIVGALTGAAGLLLQFVVLYRGMSADGDNLFGVAWRFVGFFTILTNILITGVMAGAALRPDHRAGLNSPLMEAIGATGILLVAGVYHTMLAQLWDPQGAQLISDILLHSATPVIYTLFWFARPHGELTYRDALLCMVWPLAYCGYALGRGALDGWYAYAFMDPTRASWSEIALTCGLLTAAFFVGALILVTIDRALARSTS